MAERNFVSLFLSLLVLAAALLCGPAAAAPAKCLTDCTPRIGIVSAFGEEADILVAQTGHKREHTINGNRFTTGTLRGNRVVIVLTVRKSSGAATLPFSSTLEIPVTACR